MIPQIIDPELSREVVAVLSIILGMVIGITVSYYYIYLTARNDTTLLEVPPKQEKKK